MLLKLTDAEGLANLDYSEKPLVVLDITREEIEACNIASVLERLHILTDTELNARRFKENLIFQVSGYDEDPRNLPEIREVRTYFERLNQEWPHWIWFLTRGMGSIALLLALLCTIKIHRRQNGLFGTEFVDMHQLKSVFNDMLMRGNALFAMYPSISEEEIVGSANSAVGEIMGG